jgi:hypothetical protein
MDEKKRKQFLEENQNQRFDMIKLIAKKIRETNFSDDLKRQQARFLNAQIEIGNNFWKEKKKTKEGLKLFKKRFNIKV